MHRKFTDNAYFKKQPKQLLWELTTSLVNVSLKFQTLISEICHYVLSKKCEKLLQCKSCAHFLNKNISVFAYKVVKHLTS